MGGDGGSLNNSRREHALLRTQILGSSSKPNKAHLKERSSVTQCTASKQPLQESHVVVDRIGQLYNKEALISCLLRRAEQGAQPDDNQDRFAALRHIGSLRKDTASVKLVRDGKDGAFICSVTRKVVSAEGRFSVGWQCGCVTATVEGIEGVGAPIGTDGVEDERCIACDKSGWRVPLGLTLAERNERLACIVQRRRGKRGSDKKRKRSKSYGLNEDGSQLKNCKLACDVPE